MALHPGVAASKFVIALKVSCRSLSAVQGQTGLQVEFCFVGEVVSADEADARCGRYEEQHIHHMYFLQTR